MTGTDFCVNKPHMSQSHLNHLVECLVSDKRREKVSLLGEVALMRCILN